MQRPVIKGRTLPKSVRSPFQPTPPFAKHIGNVALLVRELNSLKIALRGEFDSKVVEIEARVDALLSSLTNATEVLDSAKAEAIELIKEIKQGAPGKDADPNVVASIVLDQLPKPKEFDEDAFMHRLLSSVPKVDEDKLLKKFIKKLPEHKASLKIVRESFETDPMVVVDKILELFERGKVKFNTKHIDGYEQTMSAMWNQIGKHGYLHGGGISTVSHDSTLSGDGTPASPLHVVSSALSAVFGEVVAGSGNTFTLAQAPSGTIMLVGNGQVLTEGSDYTIAGAVITTISSWSAGQVLASYQY